MTTPQGSANSTGRGTNPLRPRSAATQGSEEPRSPATPHSPATHTSGPRPHLHGPLRVHPMGHSALLATYPDTATVLATARAIEQVAPPGALMEAVPAERSLLLTAADPLDLPVLTELLEHVPSSTSAQQQSCNVVLDAVYDGEDLADVAAFLGLSTEALITQHSSTLWRAAFAGFAPGFAYLLPVTNGERAAASGGNGTGGDSENLQHAGRVAPAAAAGGDGIGGASTKTLGSTGAVAPGPPWRVPRREQPRTRVPAGAVGLAAAYCGVYPRESPGGWQLIGRTDALLFDAERTPAALLSPGTTVRFRPRRALVHARAAARPSAPAPAPTPAHTPALEVITPGPLTLVQDAGRPGQARIGVSTSGAFDRAALRRANRAVGNPPSSAGLEILLGPFSVRALASIILAVDGAIAPVTVRRRVGRDDAELTDAPAGIDVEDARSLGPIALDAGDVLQIGAATTGVRIILAVRGGVQAPLVLGSRSRDVLSSLGPDPLTAGQQIAVGGAEPLGPVADMHASSDLPQPFPHGEEPTRIPVLPGPHQAVLGEGALAALCSATWQVRPDSDRVGVRLEGAPLPSATSGDLPSEPMVPGAIQVPPSGLPVVFGPDHPATGGYPVVAVVTRRGLDLLAQAAPGQRLRFDLNSGQMP